MPRRGNGAPQAELVTLTGELGSWRRFTDDGWGTGELVRPKGYEPVNMTGHLLATGARVNDTIEVGGSWHEHPRFGLQLRVVSVVCLRPETPDGTAAWLEATLPGVGWKRAHELVARFGVEGLWHVLEHEPLRLAELAGVTESRAMAMQSVYMSERVERDHKISLRGWGLTDRQIAHCLDVWQNYDATCQAIRNNPYQLAYRVTGFGFKRADEVAKAAGLAHDAPERVEAGVLYTLDEAMLSGHCFLWGAALQRIAAELLEVTPEQAGAGIVRAWRSRLIVRRGKRCYSGRMEGVEAKAAAGIARLILQGTSKGKGATDGNTDRAAAGPTIH